MANPEIREPAGGYWWVRRSDDRLYIVEVIDHAGKKTVMMNGSASPTWLSQFRTHFTFLERIPDHPSGEQMHTTIVQGQLQVRQPVAAITEGRVRKGGRNQGPSQIKKRPPPPKPTTVQKGGMPRLPFGKRK